MKKTGVALLGLMVLVFALGCNNDSGSNGNAGLDSGTGIRPEGEGWNPGSPMVFQGKTAGGELVEIFEYEQLPEDWENDDPTKTQITIPIPSPEMPSMSSQSRSAGSRTATTNAEAKNMTDYMEVWTKVSEIERIAGIPTTVHRYGFLGIENTTAAKNNAASTEFRFTVDELPTTRKFDAIVVVAGREHVIPGNPNRATMRPVLLATGSKKDVYVPAVIPIGGFHIPIELNSIEYKIVRPWEGTADVGRIQNGSGSAGTYTITLAARLKSEFVRQNNSYPLNALSPTDNPHKFAPQVLSYLNALQYRVQDVADLSGNYPGARVYGHTMTFAVPADAPDTPADVVSAGVFKNVKWVASVFEPLTQGSYMPGGNLSRLRVDADGDPIFINEWAIADYEHPDTAWAEARFSRSLWFSPDGPPPPPLGGVDVVVTWGND